MADSAVRYTERLFDSRKTLGPLCSAVPPNAVFAKRKNAAGGLVGQLEARKVELEPSALFR
ncbi:hypothetical protein B484DRAFT_399924 [Ochromonadaceae sp. CCMP2298]|nr:hypothetical protein B484DRAFT_399924 [Ochromonadaceae sp. CCMP2298]